MPLGVQSCLAAAFGQLLPFAVAAQVSREQPFGPVRSSNGGGPLRRQGGEAVEQLPRRQNIFSLRPRNHSGLRALATANQIVSTSNPI
jgi:hypothetical protein